MSNVTSLELSKQLFEVSGWDDTALWYNDDLEVDKPVGFPAVKEAKEHEVYAAYPAYDLGFLLRKLPAHCIVWQTPKGQYISGRIVDALVISQFKADTPEDAAAKLVIELFKHGILKPEKDKQ